jgi:glycosyltransferase involved in cell wall biosynthesis
MQGIPPLVAKASSVGMTNEKALIKRVLIFSTTYFPLVGGAEVAMKEITDRLPHFEFHLFCARIKPGLPSTEKIGNITVHRVGFGVSFDKYLLPLLGPLSAILATSYQIPATVWSLMASYGGFAALIYTWLRPKSKLLLTLQEGDPLEHYAKRAGFFRFLHKMIFRRANAVQAISRFLGSWATEMGFRGTPVIIPNGVDDHRFTNVQAPKRSPRCERLRREMGFLDSDVVLVTTSRLSLKNGIDDLIRSLSYLPINYKAFIIGEGEDREKLVTLTEQKNLQDRVLFLGRRTHDELPELLHASDIFVRPSLSEGLGNSFLEAMAAEIPVVGTPVGGIPDFLIDGETGVFCQVRDPESIARAVLRIQGNVVLRGHIIVQARNAVLDRYGWDGIANEIGQLLTSLSV